MKKEKVSEVLRNSRVKMSASKRTHATTTIGRWVRQKGCVGEGDFRPIQGSRDEIASSTRTRRTVLSPLFIPVNSA